MGDDSTAVIEIEGLVGLGAPQPKKKGEWNNQAPPKFLLRYLDVLGCLAALGH